MKAKNGLLQRAWGWIGLSPVQALIIFIPATLVLVAVALAAKFLHINVVVFLYDPATIYNAHPLTGFLSNLGILFWSVGATVCLFTAAVLRTRAPRETYLFILCSGLVTAYLTLDDMFMIHDSDGLLVRFLGSSEEFNCLVIAIGIAIYLLRFRRMILESPYGLLLVAVIFLGIMVMIDLYIDHWEYGSMADSLRNLTEDGLRWIATICWCTYFVRYCYLSLTTVNRPQ